MSPSSCVVGAILPLNLLLDIASLAGGFINENFFLAAMQLRCLGDGGWRGIRVS